MRFGVVPQHPSKRACVSSANSTHGGIRLGSAVHSASYHEAIMSLGIYLRSCETSMSHLMRVVSMDGRDPIKSSWFEVSCYRRSLP